MEGLICPFCNYQAENEYGIMYHMEELHPEGESPFIVKDGRSEGGSIGQLADLPTDLEDDLDFVDCPREDCGEKIPLTELDSHIYMHGAEDDKIEDDSQPARRQKRSASSSVSNFNISLPPALRNLEESSSIDIPPSDSQGKPTVSTNASAKASWGKLLKMPSKKVSLESASVAKKPYRRLGRAELGPYAHEKQMPKWLKEILEADGQAKKVNGFFYVGKTSKARIVENHVLGVLPVVERLLEQDLSTEYAYTCHPSVQHISKLQREGGFCGYRNIQMLASYIIETQSQGFPHFNGRIPTIFQIQEFIEHAWDIGIHAQGRLETGGIRGTRKYIGTPEAQAMLTSLDISCAAQGLKGKGSKTKGNKNKGNMSADQLLLEYVEVYFSADCKTPGSKVRSTGLPPLYFQHPGHSLTIIGFEKRKDGSRNILVFDPMFYDSSDVIRLIGQEDVSLKKPGELLRFYRRDLKYLQKYNEFEVLRLTPPKDTMTSE